MITIVDYGAGNFKSVENMLCSLGIACRISSDATVIAQAERIILPGVGHFDHGMKALRSRGIDEVLNVRVRDEGVPLLGICLGAQLLTRGSEEGEEAGLGWIDADTVAFDRERLGRALKVPHMGWADTWPISEHPLLAGISDDTRYYYVHSFHLRCDRPENSILATHHGYEFVSGIAALNVVGVQFHPEKSHRFGMEFLRAFAAWNPQRVGGNAA